jgi:hypothetical protein
MQTTGLNGAAETRFCYWINSSIKRERTTTRHQSRSPGGFVCVCVVEIVRAGAAAKIPPRPILRYYSIVSGPHPAVIDGLEKNLQQIIDIPLPRVDKESCWNIFSRCARGESGAK